MTRSPAARSGITILEVLFAILITTIGVFGIMAMLMLAGLRARQAVHAHQEAAFAQQALSEFSVRGWNREDMILVLNPTSGAATTLAQLKKLPAPVFTSVFPDRQISFCLDPLLVTNSTTFTAASPESRFPYGGSGRVFLLTMPRATVAQGPTTPTGISLPMAEKLFRFPHARSFDHPNDRTLLPVQVYDQIGTVNVQRSYVGELSWMATVTPGPSHRRRDPTTLRVYDADEYVLSVVLFRRRVPYRQSPAPANLQVNGERQLVVLQFPGTGAGGGSLQLLDTAAGTRAAAEEELKVRRGQWILLSGRFAQPPETTLHHWYRVTGAGEIERNTAGSGWTRWITVEGPDWPLEDLAIEPGSVPPRRFIRATLVDGVVSVASRSFRWEPLTTPW